VLLQRSRVWAADQAGELPDPADELSDPADELPDAVEVLL
jgi:hypothetical protein